MRGYPSVSNPFTNTAALATSVQSIYYSSTLNTIVVRGKYIDLTLSIQVHMHAVCPGSAPKADAAWLPNGRQD